MACCVPPCRSQGYPTWPLLRAAARRRVHAEDPVDLAALLAYSVQVLAAADDPEDLEPAAAALSSPASVSWPPRGSAGISRRSSSLGTASLRPGIRSSLDHPTGPRGIGDGRAEAAGSQEGNRRTRPWEPRMSRWFASSSLTSERHQRRNVVTSAAPHRESQAASLGCWTSGRGDGRGPRCSRWSRGRVPVGALLRELLAAEGHAPIH